MLKKGLIVSIIAVFAISLASCKAGPDGDVFIQFDWTITPGYNDNNSDVSKPITSNTPYLTSPGTYAFTYGGNTSCPNSHSGSYTISANSGEDGTIPFVEGDAGADANFELYLWCYSLADLTLLGGQSQEVGNKKLGVVAQDEARAVPAAAIPTQSNPVIIEQVSGNKKMTLKLWSN